MEEANKIDELLCRGERLTVARMSAFAEAFYEKYSFGIFIEKVISSILQFGYGLAEHWRAGEFSGRVLRAKSAH